MAQQGDQPGAGDMDMGVESLAANQEKVVTKGGSSFGCETEGQGANPAPPPEADTEGPQGDGETATGSGQQAAAVVPTDVTFSESSDQHAPVGAGEAPQSPLALKPADSSGQGGAGGVSQEDQGEEDGATKGELGVSIPVARVRRMMRCNPDKKKNFSKEAVQAVAAGLELFLADFAKTAYQFTADKKRKTLLIADVAECIRLIPRFEFLDGPGILPDVEDRQKRARGAAAVPPTTAAPSGAQSSVPVPAAAQPAPVAAALATSDLPAGAADDGQVDGEAKASISHLPVSAGAEVVVQ